MINFIQQVFIPSLYIYSEQNKRFKKNNTSTTYGHKYWRSIFLPAILIEPSHAPSRTAEVTFTSS